MEQSEVYEINALFDDMQYLWKLEQLLERSDYIKDITFRFKEDSKYIYDDSIVCEDTIDFRERPTIDTEEILTFIKELVQKKLTEVTAKFESYKLIRE